MLELKSPSGPVQGSLTISGSKSISNRLLILEQLKILDLTYSNLSDSEDTVLLQKALKKIQEDKTADIDVNHAGTDMRFLTALLAITAGEWTITGSERLKERPIAPLVNALRKLGAEIIYSEKEGYPPLLIKGKKLKGGIIEVDTTMSSQFASALLLIAPALSEDLILKLSRETVSMPYLQMTVSLLKECGMEVTVTPEKIELKNSGRKNSQNHFDIESDWSSASYFYSICALSPGSQLNLGHFSQISLQADSVLPYIYDQLGVTTIHNNDRLDLNQNKKPVKIFEYDFKDCPDIAQTVAVTCFGLNIEARLTGLGTLKYKESDRITALKTELENLGAKVETTADSLHLYAEFKFLTATAVINTYNDHRMAMSFASLALLSKNLIFKKPDVVKKSYPAFWNDLLTLGFNVNLQP